MSDKTSIFGVVAKVIDDFKVVVNRGVEHGVKMGTRYLIYGIGDDIKDPETGESLGAIELVRGTGKVVHVQDKICTVETDMSRTSTRKTRYRDQGYGLAMLYGKEKIEEEGESITIPFEDPQVGDKAKPI